MKKLNIKHRKFIYAFDISKECPSLADLPENIRSSMEADVVDIIYESYVVPGDQDYLIARFLAQKAFHRIFFWMAEQSIEKHLKAFLLLNGCSVKKYNYHTLNNLFNIAISINKTIENINMEPHKDIKIDPRVFQHIKKLSVHEFIKNIEEYGSPDNRYNAFGTEFNTGYLFALDNFIFHLRKKSVLPSIEDSFKGIDDELIKIFKNNNPFFWNDGDKVLTKVPSKEFPIKHSMSVTKLEFLVNNITSNHRILHLLLCLSKKMKLPKKIEGLLEKDGFAQKK